MVVAHNCVIFVFVHSEYRHIIILLQIWIICISALKMPLMRIGLEWHLKFLLAEKVTYLSALSV